MSWISVRHPVRVHAQRGMSLIELMIAMVLGLIVIAAVYNMYAGSERSARFTSGLQTMQENGRYGVSVLQSAFRLAGYSPATDLPAFDIASGSETSVVIQVQQAYDCNGGSTAATGGIAINTYRLEAANERITCKGNSAAADWMPIVEGVEAFRVLYGLDEDGDDYGVPERFVSWDATLNPNDISAVRFALLVNSVENIRTRQISETHVLLDREFPTKDRKARNVFSSTVKLRNKR